MQKVANLSCLRTGALQPTIPDTQTISIVLNYPLIPQARVLLLRSENVVNFIARLLLSKYILTAERLYLLVTMNMPQRCIITMLIFTKYKAVCVQYHVLSPQQSQL